MTGSSWIIQASHLLSEEEASVSMTLGPGGWTIRGRGERAGDHSTSAEPGLPGDGDEPEAIVDELLLTSIFLFLDERTASMASSAASLFAERGSVRMPGGGGL
jgi:hypothetical protein